MSAIYHVLTTDKATGRCTNAHGRFRLREAEKVAAELQREYDELDCPSIASWTDADIDELRESVLDLTSDDREPRILRPRFQYNYRFVVEKCDGDPRCMACYEARNGIA